jgi:hypothetical protein
MKKMNLHQKREYILNLWDKEDDYLDAMPDREMIFFFFDDENEHSVCLECNPDFFAWELDLLD